MATPSDAQRQVNETFETFRRSLQEMLESAARQQVESTLDQLGEGGPFRIEDVKVEVVLHDLKLAAADTRNRTPAAKPSRSRTARPSASSSRAAAPRKGSRRPSGRPSVRETLLGAFADSQTRLDTTQLRDHLSASGVQASADNLHQQLRRLVQAGELQREGRGVYSRASAAPQAA